MEKTQLHFIDADTGSTITRQLVFNVPSLGDEIRIGGEGNERFFLITDRIFCYDEYCPYERVNLGVREVMVDDEISN